ncbi:hypothetical protein LOAG_14791 [Loa loa]|uniref:Uncharacterized protein n=1 Tax=Loa loa TaxID=7209 RepID=A0A1S0THL6_LOALO|nr:hypothetical protein LOAG_14791 [Loa loa]EFO13737.1 hypothetical protein LOAG_14791 [Loa loa]
MPEEKVGWMRIARQIAQCRSITLDDILKWMQILLMAKYAFHSFHYAKFVARS